ncbi:hypothetical protein [Kitasatospora sp. NPDC004289]
MIARPTGQADGPYGAAFLPRLRLTFRPAEHPITEPVAKLGGAPVWLAEPAWPLDPRTGEPLVFVGQFPIPGDELRLAYLFVEEEDMIMGGLGPEDGDAVVLVQPGGRVPHFAVPGPTGTRGRTLWRWGPDDREVPVEGHLDLTPAPPGLDGYELGTYLGGTAYLSHGRPGLDSPWEFLLQLGDCGGAGEDPYFLNFGGGHGYVFLSPDHLEGRFYWEAP